jgi:uncharacterized protein (TIGR00730 family)
MVKAKNVCVYCGSSTRVDQVYQEAALRLGEILARANMGVVYGGGKLGLMGLIADSTIAHGGQVVGFIPKLLTKYEGAHPNLTEIHIVDTMHTRKRLMSERADAFVILPGGFGTLDELFEILTWRQLQMHDKPIIVVNINHYWDPLKSLIHNVVEEKFATPAHAQFVHFVNSVDEVLNVLISSPEPGVEFAGQLI